MYAFIKTIGYLLVSLDASFSTKCFIIMKITASLWFIVLYSDMCSNYYLLLFVSQVIRTFSVAQAKEVIRSPLNPPPHKSPSPPRRPAAQQTRLTSME